jgi:putative FmdB family regulatory protein
MPIYEYACRKCAHQFEALQRMGDKACPPCEKCGAKKTERKFSTFAMHGGGSRSEGGGGGHSHGSGCGGCSKSSCGGCRH